MSYYKSKILNSNFEDAELQVRRLLQKEGFGVLTEIDIQQKLHEKLNVKFRRYKILGACNPLYAYEALKAEDKIGTMLPCNVIIQELKEGRIEIAAVNPIESMMAVKNKSLNEIASEIKEKLAKVIDSLENSDQSPFYF
ncbi:DUF302 domain-containing protein [Labilibaculum euxinus]|uniref:DUF302 domain-containing protein n=1 Tax=Labilibaculum euxinus TaxID=2686357 RepID=A0A7M4D9S1_9BACT|nr:DUF302 domain-containing protein [Labilibaculum euxinus]MUP39400.1 DUF302 domain-containing protein [Labilibaculum euxinus]MVB08605.1 DUF302 domain-containing protein [Labilibaculum euxinus]